MSESPNSVKKMPFILADVILILIALLILCFSKHPLSAVHACIVTLLVGIGAFISIIPWKNAPSSPKETPTPFSSEKHVDENIYKITELIASLNSSVASLGGIQRSIDESLLKFEQSGQELPNLTNQFSQSVQKATDYDRSVLESEIARLQQIELTLLNTIQNMMDHVLALTAAGINSGQPSLAKQMRRFRAACNEFITTAGLSFFLPQIDSPYDPEKELVPEGEQTPEAGTKITRVLSIGFNYHGKLLRKPIVLTEGMTLPEEFFQKPQIQNENVTATFTSAPVQETIQIEQPEQPIQEEPQVLIQETLAEIPVEAPVETTAEPSVAEEAPTEAPPFFATLEEQPQETAPEVSEQTEQPAQPAEPEPVVIDEAVEREVREMLSEVINLEEPTYPVTPKKDPKPQVSNDDLFLQETFEALPVEEDKPQASNSDKPDFPL